MPITRKIFLALSLGAVILGIYYVAVIKRQSIKPRWSTQIYEEIFCENCETDIAFNILKSDYGDDVSGEKILTHYTGLEVSGWDFAVLVRHKDDKNYYRLMISAKRDEIALWKPEGGFLAVEKFPFKNGKWYTAAIRTENDQLTVSINNEKILSYRDKIASVLNGSVGQARYGNAVVLSRKPKVNEISEINTDIKSLNHQPLFQIKNWRNAKWIFDGNEPIAKINERELIISQVKLKPGYKPSGYWDLFWKQYKNEDFYANKLTEPIQISEDKNKITLTIKSATSNKTIGSFLILELNYDSASDSYIYNAETFMEVNPGQTWEYDAYPLYGLEYLSFVSYNAVPPGSISIKDEWPKDYEWILYKNPEGKWYRQPINHNSDVNSSVSISPKGGKYIYGISPIVNPAISVPEDKTTHIYEHLTQLCLWAYDSHFKFRPFQTNTVLKEGEKYYASYTIATTNINEAQATFERSFLDPAFAQLKESEAPIYRRAINDFAIGRNLAEPHNEWIWRGNYFWDKTTGENDTFSIRLGPGDGSELHETAVVGTAGPSYFTRTEEIPAGVYTISASLKTKNMIGEKPTISFSSKHPETKPVIFTIEAPANTKEWQKISFDTYLPKSTGITLSLNFSGKGYVWFDNVTWQLKKKDKIAPIKTFMKLIFDKTGEKVSKLLFRNQ